MRPESDVPTTGFVATASDNLRHFLRNRLQYHYPRGEVVDLTEPLSSTDPVTGLVVDNEVLSRELDKLQYSDSEEEELFVCLLYTSDAADE